jgi:hypothetical protein
MSREIKFRAWDEITESMVSWSELTSVKNNLKLSVLKGVTSLKWMQFTGLIDKNGVDIYEGDNVIQHIESEFLDRSDWRVIESSVLVIDGEWCVGSTRYPLYGFSNAVIGNIHETKL